MLWAGALGLAAATVLARFGESHWLLDLLSHFPLHFAVLALALACVAATRGAILPMLLAAVVAAGNGAVLRSPPKQEAVAGGSRLSRPWAGLGLCLHLVG